MPELVRGAQYRPAKRAYSRGIDERAVEVEDGPAAHGAGRTALGHPTAATAARIAATDTSGCDTIDTCEASTSVIVAPARSAILRCAAGGMILSSVPITEVDASHVSMVSHPDVSVAAILAAVAAVG